MKFEWNPSKAASNLDKHGVSFQEAKTVFDNPLAAVFDDEAHPIGEIREIIIGYSQYHQLLTISFTDRTDFIRIISARFATHQERKDYEQHRP